jgi:hypothetical protein
LWAGTFVSDETGEKEQVFDFGTTCALSSSETKATRQFHDPRQSFWPDNIIRDLLNSRVLRHYIDKPTVIFATTAVRIDWQEE